MVWVKVFDHLWYWLTWVALRKDHKLVVLVINSIRVYNSRQIHAISGKVKISTTQYFFQDKTLKKGLIGKIHGERSP